MVDDKWIQKGATYFTMRLVISTVILCTLSAATLFSSFGDDANEISDSKLLVKLILLAVALTFLLINFVIFEFPQYRHHGCHKYFSKVDNWVDCLQLFVQIFTVVFSCLMFSNPESE